MRNIRRTMIAGALAFPMAFGFAGVANAADFSQEEAQANANGVHTQSVQSSTGGGGASFHEESNSATVNGSHSQATSSSADGNGNASFQQESASANANGASSNSTSSSTGGGIDSGSTNGIGGGTGAGDAVVSQNDNDGLLSGVNIVANVL